MVIGNSTRSGNRWIQIRLWLALLCVSLTAFSAISHSICVDIRASSSTQIVMASAQDNTSDSCPATVNGGTHCAFCCGGTAVAPSSQQPVFTSSVSVENAAVADRIPSVATTFDPPPPKALT
jgi:hypothetical protein